MLTVSGALALMPHTAAYMLPNALAARYTCTGTHRPLRVADSVGKAQDAAEGNSL